MKKLSMCLVVTMLAISAGTAFIAFGGLGDLIRGPTELAADVVEGTGEVAGDVVDTVLPPYGNGDVYEEEDYDEEGDE